MEARAPICHVRIKCPVPRREVGSASHTGPHRRLTDPPRERNRHEDLRHRSDRVLGRRAVSQLVAAGVEVTGVARSREKAVELRDLGAAPVEVSLFDTDQLTAAIAGHEAVCNLATAIPTGTGPPPGPPGTRTTRSGETAHGTSWTRRSTPAQTATSKSRTRSCTPTGPTSTWTSRRRPTRRGSPSRHWPPRRSGPVRRPRRRGIALRFGVFYGPDSIHTIDAIEAAQRGLFPVPGPAGAYLSSVTTDDAASAVVAALGAPSGVYNVADDRPLRRSEVASALAEALGTNPLRLPPGSADLPQDLSMMLRSQRVTSQLFKTLTGWQPRFPSAREGWRFVVAELRQRPVA